MCLFERPLEFRKHFHELACGLSWGCIHLRVRAQTPNEAREQALHRPHNHERGVDEIVPDATGEVAYLIAQEHAEINVFDDELYARDCGIETRPTRSVYTRPAARLVTREYKKADEERERDEEEDEICHGYERAESRANLLTSVRSPNFCVASLRRSRTVLLSSLINGWSRST